MSETCEWCEEPLLDHEMNPRTPYLKMHSECGFRITVGSLAHLEGRCACYVAGSKEEDPPELSRRAAAKAALGYWTSLTEAEQDAAILRPRREERLRAAVEEKEKTMKEKAPMKMADLPIMAEFDAALGKITDEDVERAGARLLESSDGDEPLGVIHSEQARRLWVLISYFQKCAILEAVKGRFDTASKEEMEQCVEGATRFGAIEECARDLFWASVKSDIGGKAWRSAQVGLRRGWMLVANSQQPAASIKGLLRSLGLPMPEDPSE